METIKVKPWSNDQGDFVVINAADFDPAVHVALDDKQKKPAHISRNAIKDLSGESVGSGG